MQATYLIEQLNKATLEGAAKCTNCTGERTLFVPFSY